MVYQRADYVERSRTLRRSTSSVALLGPWSLLADRRAKTELHFLLQLYLYIVSVYAAAAAAAWPSKQLKMGF